MGGEIAPTRKKRTIMLVTAMAALALLARSGELSGDWLSDCLSDGSSGQELYVVHAESFTDTAFAFTISENRSDGCRNLAVTFNASGTYATGRADGVAGTGIDLTYGASTMTPASGLVANFMNSDATCGLTNWQSGAANDVSGLVCNGQQVPARGAVVHDAYTLANGQLTFGDGVVYRRR
jgi:hypothetical protein